MPQGLKGAESVHSDQHDCRMSFLQQLTLVMRQRKNNQAVYNSYDKPAKKVSENSEASPTSKKDK